MTPSFRGLLLASLSLSVLALGACSSTSSNRTNTSDANRVDSILDRAAREAIYAQMCDQLNAAPIQHIGKLLVLWRPQPEKLQDHDETRMPGPRHVKVLKYSKRGGQRPEVLTLRVLGNERLTSGGKIKRAKAKKPVSLKKRQSD